MEFVCSRLGSAQIADKHVLEIGSQDVNGSVRPHVMSFDPASYVGIDFAPGDGVDVVCDACSVVDRFGEKSVDVVISTEMLEHASDWRCAVSNMKRCLRPGGLLLLTTRSIGFPLHAFPHDYWRFQVVDMRRMLADMAIYEIIPDPDPGTPGVFAVVRKPDPFLEIDLSGMDVYSMADAPVPEPPPPIVR